MVKEKYLQQAVDTFGSTGIKISCEGAGVPIGTEDFIKEFVREKVADWQASVEVLSSFATSQPHAAYSAMTHGLSSQWLFLQRTVPALSPLLQPLENTISDHFIPALTGRGSCTKLECDLFALPARLGGLGLTNPTKSAVHQLTARSVSASILRCRGV